MTKVLRLLPLLAAPALAGCGGISIPEQSLPDVVMTTPVTLDSGNLLVNNVVLFREAPLFTAPVDSRIKDVRVSGTATLNTPASSKLVLDVLLVSDLSGLGSTCASYEGYRACIGAGTAQNIGTVTVDAGQTVGTVTLGGSLLTTLAHQGKGHLGLHIQQGVLPKDSTLSLTNMKVGAKATLF